MLMRIIKQGLLVVLLILLTDCNAFAWGWKGHKVIALIAEKHLSGTARAAVLGLLAEEGHKSMADVATWADHVRILPIPIPPTHTVSMPLDDSKYDPERDCREHRCAIAALDADVAILKDPSSNKDVKLEAMKYLIHLVGDLHQPMHTTKDKRLQLKVVLDGKEQTLHEVWDTAIYESKHLDTAQLVDEVERTAPAYQSDKSGFGDWAAEGRDIARDTILPQVIAAGPASPMQLGSDYTERNWPIVRDRLYVAGRRLADLLNDIYKPH